MPFQVRPGADFVAAINALPTTLESRTYWPCAQGEQYPPTLSTGATYAARAGQSTVQLAGPVATGGLAGTPAQPAIAQWGRIQRYSPLGTERLVRLTFLWYTILKPVGAATVGFQRNNTWNHGMYEQTTTANQPAVVGLAVNDQQFPITGGVSLLQGWHFYELIYAPGYTRLTIDKSADLRVVGPPLLDINLGPGPGRAEVSSGYNGDISSLVYDYPETV